MPSPSKLILPTALALVALIPSSLAHGYLAQISISGKTYPGFNFKVDPYLSPAARGQVYARKNDGDGPCQPDFANWEQCSVIFEGANAEKMEKDWPTGSIPVKGGEEVTVTWGEPGNWPDSHVGGIANYMANCGTTCTGIDAGSLDWFKITEENYDTATSTWPLTKLSQNKGVYSFTLPSDLPGGAYMVKHELLAPFNGQQFYPSAFQIDLDSSGTTVPAPTGKFPDMYTGFTPLTTDGPSFKYPGIEVYQNGVVKGDSGGAATGGDETVPIVDPVESGVVSTSLVPEPTVAISASTSASVEPTSVEAVSTASTTEISSKQAVPTVPAVLEPTVAAPTSTGTTVEPVVETTSAGDEAPTSVIEPVPMPSVGGNTLPIEYETTVAEAETTAVMPVGTVPTTADPAPTVVVPTSVESVSTASAPVSPVATGSAYDFMGYTGSIGAPAPAVSKNGNSYVSAGGRKFNFLYDALEGSCDSQRIACMDVSNKLPNAEVAALQTQCITQVGECFAWVQGAKTVAKRWTVGRGL